MERLFSFNGLAGVSLVLEPEPKVLKIIQESKILKVHNNNIFNTFIRQN